MTIGNIIKPWSFTNNTETADATKINTDFDVAISGVNDCIDAINAAEGTAGSLSARLSVSINPDGSIKAISLPEGTYDSRRIRIVDADTTLLADDAILMVDTSAGNITITLPAVGTMTNSPIILNTSSAGNFVILTPAAGETVMGIPTIEFNGGGESIRIAPGPDAQWWRIG